MTATFRICRAVGRQARPRKTLRGLSSSTSTPVSLLVHLGLTIGLWPPPVLPLDEGGGLGWQEDQQLRQSWWWVGWWCLKGWLLKEVVVARVILLGDDYGKEEDK